MKTSPQYLSPVDAAWFRMEQRDDPADIVALMQFDGELDERALRTLVSERLLSHPRFSRRVVDSPHAIAPPHWEQELALSLDDHLTRVSLPPPTSEAALATAVHQLLREPLDFAHSPWRLWLIEGLPTGSALLVQLHHCMGDGFGLLEVLLSLADRQGHDGQGAHLAAADAVRSTNRGAWQLGATVRASLGSLGHILLLPFDPPTRLRGRPSGERRLAWSRKMPLAPVKRMAASRGATVNDVLVGALASAFRRYFLSHGDEPVAIRAMVPVNLRPPRAPGDSIFDEHHNWFGLVFVDLPIDEPDRERRLSKLKAEMDRIKASKEAAVSLAVLEVLGRSPAIVEHLADEVFARKASMVITNVPGPRSKLQLAGRPVLDMVFWAPHPCGLGCGASILSYAGMVRVGIRGDAAVVPDPELVTHYFEQELEDWGASPRDDAIAPP